VEEVQKAEIEVLEVLDWKTQSASLCIWTNFLLINLENFFEQYYEGNVSFPKENILTS